MSTLPTAVVTVTVDAPFAAVAAYLADPSHNHEWATEFFSGPLRPTGAGEYVADVPMMGGPVRYRQDADPTRGIIDVYLAPEGANFGPPLPVRVVPNGDGADVLYVLARFPGTPEEAWQAGLASMRRELGHLKAQLEA